MFVVGISCLGSVGIKFRYKVVELSRETVVLPSAVVIGDEICHRWFFLEKGADVLEVLVGFFNCPQKFGEFGDPGCFITIGSVVLFLQEKIFLGSLADAFLPGCHLVKGTGNIAGPIDPLLMKEVLEKGFRAYPLGAIEGSVLAFGCGLDSEYNRVMITPSSAASS